MSKQKSSEYVEYGDFRLQIQPIIDRSTEIHQQVVKSLPTHTGLQGISLEIVKAAEKSKHVAEKQNHFFSIHKIPIYLSLLLAFWGISWIILTFFVQHQLSIALPNRDTTQIANIMKQRSDIKVVNCIGSREGIAMLEADQVDVAFVQGGIEFPSHYKRFALPSRELIVFMVRKHVEDIRDIKKVCTSIKTQGSHTMAQKCLDVMGKSDVEFVHVWPNLTQDENYVLDKDIQAVLVVKSINEKSLKTIRRLLKDGFVFHTVDLGIQGDTTAYLEKVNLPAGYIFSDPLAPSQSISSYWVKRYVIAHPKVHLDKIRSVAHMLYPANIDVQSSQESAVSVFMQRADAFSQTFVSVGIILVSLFGLSVLSFRRRFNELNTLVSLINMLQSTKDLHEETDSKTRRENIHYLACCSDLLSIIDIVTGYYAQQNSTLLFNGFCGIIHQRCSDLKLNIQLKIQHATLKHTRILSQNPVEFKEKKSIES